MKKREKEREGGGEKNKREKKTKLYFKKLVSLQYTMYNAVFYYVRKRFMNPI